MKVLLALSYLVIACGFALRTYEEGRTSKEGGPIRRVIGLLLSLVWPVMILCVGIEVVRLSRRLTASRRILLRAIAVEPIPERES
jgi:hypothetical protein